MNIDEISYRIVDSAVRRLKEHFPSLIDVIDMLKIKSINDMGTISVDKGKVETAINTDGEHLIFIPEKVKYNYAASKLEAIEYAILHVLSHCLLGHLNKVGQYSAKKLAWGVMDIEVEQFLLSIGMEIPPDYNADLPFALGHSSLKENGLQTIDMGLYYKALKDKNLARRVRENNRYNKLDDHSFWWIDNRFGMLNDGGGGSPSGSGNKDDSSSRKSDRWEKAREYLLGKEGDLDGVYKDIEKLSEAIKKYKDTKKHIYGDTPGEYEGKVKAHGEEKDFSSVLKQFIATKFTSKDTDEAMDRMLYKYGLDVYGNIPLIEPDDEIEERRLENVVIAIDTSGSCTDYEGVFLKQLIAIFREFKDLSFEGIYLLQADCKIQKAIEFKDYEELSEIESSMRMYGYGGTDFRPVFKWVDKNLLSGDKKVDCMIYFTDAEGDFPEKKPEYPVFFVIPRECDECLDDRSEFRVEIPEWVNKLVL